VNHSEKYSLILKKYIPENAVKSIVELIFNKGVHLKITKSRSTKLGDFKPSQSLRGHFITVNHDLNKYSFLITLLHEFAHLETWNNFGSLVKPHGAEWKYTFQKVMSPFLNEENFPPEVLSALVKYLNNPSASSCVDQHLMRVLKKHDNDTKLFLEDLPLNSLFKLKTGRIFIKAEEKRKFYTCIEISSNRKYLVNRLAEVELIK
jgi:hypothetical protein